MKHVFSGTLPEIRDWLRTLREKKIERVIDAADKRAPGADVQKLDTAIIDPRSVNVFEDPQVPAWLRVPKRGRKS